MDDKTLEALKGSIKKWEAIIAGTGTNEGPANCPLCIMFLKEGEDGCAICFGCPVRDNTGQSCCSGTPYDEYEFHEIDYGAGSDECMSAAEAELEFLRSLLPTRSTPDTGEKV